MKLKRISNCARCGQDHEDIEYESFTHPIVDSDRTEWTHFAKCPTNGQPILIKMEPKAEVE